MAYVPAMRPFSRLAATVAALALAACGPDAGHVAPAPPLNVAVNLDTTCAPCTDFYQFANGGWLKTAKMPDTYAQIGVAREVYDRNQEVLHAILDKSAADFTAGRLEKGSGAWKVGAYYAGCMDTVAIDKLGAAPLKPTLDMIDAIATPEDLKKALGALEKQLGLAPWSAGAEPNPNDATQEIIGLGQGGFTLPDRDYYFKTDSATRHIRDEYLGHVTRMFQLLGESPTQAIADAKTVMAVETKFAGASRPPVALRDPVANTHVMTLAQASALTPHVQLGDFLATQGAAAGSPVDVGQPEFFKALDGMLASVPVADWKTLLRWRAVHAVATAMPTAFVNENFTFAQLFSGTKKLTERWKRCAQRTDQQLGELLGQEYVKQNFTPEAKARAVKIVASLVDELHTRLDSLDWMSAPTKAQALAKLAAFTRKIGYPDQWRDYSKLDVSDGQYVTTSIAALQWESARDWAKVGKPVDRTEWGMTPPTVNAYYNPQLNEIVFPAGILQPPFYDPSADDAVNYGAMGAIIGHEMTHGFDDEGRQFDKNGNLKDWWTKEDAVQYVAEADKVAKQFDGYTVIDSATHVNGKLTLGENIADFGGLTVAYAAM